MDDKSKYFNFEGCEINGYDYLNKIKMFYSNDDINSVINLTKAEAKQLGQWLIQMSER